MERPMTDELVFYTNPMSRGRIARWMLEEIGPAVSRRSARIRDDDEGAGLSGVNPMGKVPAIAMASGRHRAGGGLRLSRRRVSRRPASRRRPAIRRRAAYYRWMFFAAGPLEAATTNKALGFVDAARARAAMAGYGCLRRRRWTRWSGRCRSGEYLAGEKLHAPRTSISARRSAAA